MKLSDIKITPIMESLRLEDISDEVYFGKKYSNYISNSRLGLLALTPKDPTKFFEGLQKNNKYADCLLFGSAVHELTLEPESFYLCESVNRPTSKAGMMADKLYNPERFPNYEEMKNASMEIDYYSKNWNSEKADALKEKCSEYWKTRSIFENESKDSRTPIYLDEKNRIRLKECLGALQKDNNIQNLLHKEQSGNEITILLDIEVEAPNNPKFILHLKGKVDNYSVEDDIITVNDIKTTGKYVTYFKDAINSFHYYRELAMYSYLLRLCGKKFFNIENATIKGNFLVVQTIPQYYTSVVPMTPELYKEGLKEFKHLLRLVAFYCCNPDYEGFREII